MEQNILIQTEDGEVKLQFDHCLICKFFSDCYKTHEGYHKGVPQFITQECVEGPVV